MNNSNRPLGWTTLEESKQLVEAGLDKNTADMWISPKGIYIGRKETPIKYETFPCWSLGALVQMLPLNIQTGDSFLDEYDLEFKLDSRYMVAYCIDQSHHPMIYTEKHETLIEACIEMVIWLLNNKML